MKDRQREKYKSMFCNSIIFALSFFPPIYQLNVVIAILSADCITREKYI